ncbi:cobalt chelatase [Pusillimonas sp. MFBS29]|uniref:cobaltochelatase CobT-related protein n=1 Tax=Pusillimonas sp. MFBS29 TaxID=2886690 RepID=UPI001D11104D|nr:cobalt chelatase [Pusillimonas sp. MFBS29]MCC2596444.1 cobalt chelatase [Pusillimonas sp. MFBS29]
MTARAPANMADNAQQRVRVQHKSEALSAVALRALTGCTQLHFEGGHLYGPQGRIPVHAPHLQLQPGVDTLQSYRGVADAVALRLQLSDAGLHADLMPQEPVERMVFEWLEQLRVESLAPETLPGLRRNVIRRYQIWSEAFLDSGATETSLGILLFALSQITWSRLMAHELPGHVQDLLEPTRAGLAPAIGTALAGLRRYRNDQRRYADYALQIAHEMAQRVQSEYEDSPQTKAVRRGSFTLSLDFDQDEGEAYAAAHEGDSAVFAQAKGRYRIFTQRYDKELDAAALVRAPLLREYRETLDKHVAGQGVNVARLTRALRVVLARSQRDGWLFGQEEGVIDGRRLAQLISSPAERRLFRQDQYIPVIDCAISFLIDCSGSMRQYSTSLTLMMDILMRALGQAGVATEVLGFTTMSWNGGRARKDWFAAGKPDAPGRLNETCHLVFKDVDTSWRRGRAQIVAMMKPDLYREGVDGEAVQWASRRLMATDRRRRILMVVSDGSPMDSATNLANDEFYLDNHLKSVVRQITQTQPVEILGLGVGLDLSPYYPRSLPMDLTQGLDNAVFDELLMLLAGREPGFRQ